VLREQVQVVAYLHEWQPDAERAGDFYFWNGEDKLGTKELPVPNAGSGVDGTKTVHASTTYLPRRPPPALSKDDDARLLFKPANGTWEVVKVVDGDAKADAEAMEGPTAGPSAAPAKRHELVGRYPEADLRTSIVYRARCFADAAEAEAFAAQVHERPPSKDDPDGEGALRAPATGPRIHACARFCTLLYASVRVFACVPCSHVQRLGSVLHVQGLILAINAHPPISPFGPAARQAP